MQYWVWLQELFGVTEMLQDNIPSTVVVICAALDGEDLYDGPLRPLLFFFFLFEVLILICVHISLCSSLFLSLPPSIPLSYNPTLSCCSVFNSIHKMNKLIKEKPTLSHKMGFNIIIARFKKNKKQNIMALKRKWTVLCRSGKMNLK